MKLATPQDPPKAVLFVASRMLVLLVSLGLMTWALHTMPSPSQLFEKRTWTTWTPGDCLHAVVETDERWHEQAAKEILMIVEVGNAHYRVKTWGHFGVGDRYRWFPYEERRFSQLDDPIGPYRYVKVSCPEEEPEELPTVATRTGGEQTISGASLTWPTISLDASGSSGWSNTAPTSNVVCRVSRDWEVTCE